MNLENFNVQELRGIELIVIDGGDGRECSFWDGIVDGFIFTTSTLYNSFMAGAEAVADNYMN